MQTVSLNADPADRVRSWPFSPPGRAMKVNLCMNLPVMQMHGKEKNQQGCLPFTGQPAPCLLHVKPVVPQISLKHIKASRCGRLVLPGRICSLSTADAPVSPYIALPTAMENPSPYRFACHYGESFSVYRFAYRYGESFSVYCLAFRNGEYFSVYPFTFHNGEWQHKLHGDFFLWLPRIYRIFVVYLLLYLPNRLIYSFFLNILVRSGSSFLNCILQKIRRSQIRRIFLRI